MHARYYHRHWGFGQVFEAKVAAGLAEFLARRDPARDLFLNAYHDGRVVGSVTLDVTGGGPSGAHLRWFIVSNDARGTGLGGVLLSRAIAFCDEAGLPCWLTTFSGLQAARALYERQGFTLASESEVDQWSGGVREQLFQRPASLRAAAG
ncbi:MAG: GNAT family N-acetyltransferase [Rhizobiaceae bacterium]|nr:GNAT family N-acetyltransferase [Rhizobiaceae bacterium]